MIQPSLVKMKTFLNVYSGGTLDMQFDENLDPSGNFYWPAKENSYRATVHNLEVEDFHTYFVGTDGVWVHDASLQNDAITEGIFRDKWGRRVQWW
jgi:hypothetical protein